MSLAPFRLTRRGALAGGAALAAMPVRAGREATETAPREETARGMVFEDTDGTGQRRANSRGLPDVLVSNGRNVARTDAEGRWSLPVRDGDSLFVIKPTGWMTPLDPATRLPRFSHLHAPGGTPAGLGLRYRGLAPTGPLPESVDFPLRRQEESGRFEAILFTDPQPESAAELCFVRDDVVGRAALAEAAFGITLGDVMFDDLSMYARSNRIIGTLGLPWYNLPGNHDMNLEAPDDTHSRETFKRVFGARRYAWQWGGVTFLALDDVQYLGGDKYRGWFGPEQLGFMRAVLAAIPSDSPVVACMHIPLRTAVGTEPNIAAVDAEDFLRALGGRTNVLSLAGHTHTNEWHELDLGEERTHRHHVLSAVSGSWWSGPFDARGIPVAVATDGAPNGFHVLTVEDGRLSTRLIPAHEPAEAGLRIVLDRAYHRAKPEVVREYRMGELLGSPLPLAELPSTQLVVNLFEGGPRSRVEFSAGADAPWRPMQRVARMDPYVQELYLRNEATKKPWVTPGVSTHIWQAPLPEDLGPGVHRVSVRARDENGRAQSGVLVLEVVT